MLRGGVSTVRIAYRRIVFKIERLTNGITTPPTNFACNVKTIGFCECFIQRHESAAGLWQCLLKFAIRSHSLESWSLLREFQRDKRIQIHQNMKIQRNIKFNIVHYWSMHRHCCSYPRGCKETKKEGMWIYRQDVNFGRRGTDTSLYSSLLQYSDCASSFYGSRSDFALASSLLHIPNLGREPSLFILNFRKYLVASSAQKNAFGKDRIILFHVPPTIVVHYVIRFYLSWAFDRLSRNNLIE
jgi:hypothetical protein